MLVLTLIQFNYNDHFSSKHQHILRNSIDIFEIQCYLQDIIEFMSQEAVLLVKMTVGHSFKSNVQQVLFLLEILKKTNLFLD